ncbi:hypothetical protein [Paraburkholderia sp.]|uniref:hypothetical protein n=1 Tax=Paraburkholderia sp. TaxID=1926495 RepID=UPI002389CEFA|nr:hypothetical protein [Paraburkholderia sp.]MDE1182862.1 hypothetical protein [Paraburkholderia sp.]
MARPRIGVFGILMVVGGMLALRWAQKHGGAQLPLGRELNRWENEGGNVVTPSAVVPKTGVAPRGVANGADHANGAGPWPFPHS